MNETEYFDSEDTQRVVDAMAKAGWLTGNNIVTPGPIHLEFTEKGKSRMRLIAEPLAKSAPQIFGGEKSQSPDSTETFMEIFGAALSIRSELTPPEFTPRETNALIALVACYAKDHVGDQPPPR